MTFRGYFICLEYVVSIFLQEIALANKGKFNFDHPNAFDNELMESCLKDIMEGRPTKVHNNRKKETRLK